MVGRLAFDHLMSEGNQRIDSDRNEKGIFSTCAKSIDEYKKGWCTELEYRRMVLVLCRIFGVGFPFFGKARRV